MCTHTHVHVHSQTLALCSLVWKLAGAGARSQVRLWGRTHGCVPTLPELCRAQPLQHWERRPLCLPLQPGHLAESAHTSRVLEAGGPHQVGVGLAPWRPLSWPRWYLPTVSSHGPSS